MQQLTLRQFSSITALTSRSSTWRNKGLLRAASLTGLNVRTIEEPRWTPEDVDAFESARNETISRGAAQAWMSHVNVLKVFLNSNDTTTLILEDDVDWDVNIKEQMSEVSVQLQDHYASSGLDIGLEPADLSREYPYGISTWDVLWLGHCGNSFNEWSSTPIAPPSPSLQPDGRRVAHLQNTTITYHDQSAPQSEILDSHLLPFSTANNHHVPQRGIFSPAAPICTFAYAVTKSSASRILDEVTRSGLVESAFDVKLYSLCRWGGLRCVSVLPEVFHHQETAAKGGGSLIKSVDGVGENVNNNEENGNNKDQDAKERWTANIRYSARCNSEAEPEKSADKIGRIDNGYRRWLGKGKKLMWKTCLAPLQDNDAGERG